MLSILNKNFEEEGHHIYFVRIGNTPFVYVGSSCHYVNNNKNTKANRFSTTKSHIKSLFKQSLINNRIDINRTCFISKINRTIKNNPLAYVLYLTFKMLIEIDATYFVKNIDKFIKEVYTVEIKQYVPKRLKKEVEQQYIVLLEKLTINKNNAFNTLKIKNYTNTYEIRCKSAAAELISSRIKE